MAVRKAINMLSNDICLDEAILFVVGKSPGLKAKGVVARLRSYGWVKPGEYLGKGKLTATLNSLVERGMIVANRDAHLLSYWPRPPEVKA
jgi:hypothetical protein